MARLIPLVLIALALWFWFRARKKTAAYMDSYEAPEAHARDRHDHRGPPAPAP
ncbi:hypothetical protein ABZ371_23040 [Streptomyces sp. NPDC005899]|uniref:hypothetical protein n=1 Tax=Streptomyces sp. NPDC005899 TaxID=3155716 RepID=UPI003401E503